jgi:hypothetical protein
MCAFMRESNYLRAFIRESNLDHDAWHRNVGYKCDIVARDEQLRDEKLHAKRRSGHKASDAACR